MADFGNPVAQNVTTPNVATTLSGMMGLQQQKQAIQSGALQIQQQQQNLDKGAAETQQQQQTAAQRKGIAGIDWSKYDDGTGTISTDKMIGDKELQGRSGDQFPALLQQAAAARQQQLQNKQALVSLNDGLRSQFGAVVGALRTDPDVLADNPTGRQKVTDAISQFGQAGGPDAAKIAQIYGPVAQHAPQGQLARGINAIQLQAMDASKQAQKQAPSYANTGGELQQTNPQAAGGNLASPQTIGNNVAPGTQTFQGADGNTYAFDPRNPGKTILLGHGGDIHGSTAPQPAASGAHAMVTPDAQLQGIRDSIPYLQQEVQRAQQSGDPQAVAGAQRQLADAQARLGNNQPFTPQPKGNAPPTLTVGEADQVKANTHAVTSNRQQAADAQLQHDILNRIQSLATTPGLYLGPGSRHLADLATTVSQIPGFEGAAKYANNYNELTKFMAQNAARQGASMGLSGSDARLDMATHAQPNADPMDPRTVQNVAQYMGGVVRMGLAKADAMDNWLKQPGNGLQNEHEFEKVWRDNADPRLFQLAEMKDQGEAANYAKLHIRPSEQKALQAKHDALQKLGVF